MAYGCGTPKSGVVRTHALEQAAAYRSETPWAVQAREPLSGVEGDRMDRFLQSKLNSMSEQVGGLWKTKRCPSGSPSRLDQCMDSAILNRCGGVRPGAGPGAPRCGKMRKSASARRPRVVDPCSPGFLERIFQDVETQRVSLGDALGTLEEGFSGSGCSRSACYTAAGRHTSSACCAPQASCATSVGCAGTCTCPTANACAATCSCATTTPVPCPQATCSQVICSSVACPPVACPPRTCQVTFPPMICPSVTCELTCPAVPAVPMASCCSSACTGAADCCACTGAAAMECCSSPAGNPPASYNVPAMLPACPPPSHSAASFCELLTGAQNYSTISALPPSDNGGSFAIEAQPFAATRRFGESCDRCSVLRQQLRAVTQSLVGVGARITQWLQTAGLNHEQSAALIDIIVDYSKPCSHVDKTIASLMSELASTARPGHHGYTLMGAKEPFSLGSSARSASTHAAYARPGSPQGFAAGASWGGTGLQRSEPVSTPYGEPQQQLQQQQPQQQQLQQQQLQPQPQLLPMFGSDRPGTPQLNPCLQYGLDMRAKADRFLQRHGFDTVTGSKKIKRGGISSGHTFPLHFAVEKADTEAVEALVWCGANVSEADSQGKTPLTLAHQLNTNDSHRAIIAVLQEGLAASQERTSQP